MFALWYVERRSLAESNRLHAAILRCPAGFQRLDAHIVEVDLADSRQRQRDVDFARTRHAPVERYLAPLLDFAGHPHGQRLAAGTVIYERAVGRCTDRLRDAHADADADKCTRLQL